MENLSKFPKEIDEFPRLYDLPPSLAVKAKRYQELKMMSVLDSVEQEELNGLIIDLGNYIITPQTMNKFADGMVNLQTFFKEQVDDYIKNKQSEWSNYVKDFKKVGEYSSSVQYRFQNMVTYKGDLYLCLVATSKGVAPTNTTNWQQISTKGDKGDVGLNTHLKGQYSSTTAYTVGDAVYYDNTIYYCIKNATGINPSNSDHWMIYDKQYVGKNPPSSTQKGLIWIELID